MPRTRIKICGVRNIETALATAAAGADAIGLVFVDSSPRHVSVDTARRIVTALPAWVTPVGLFVDEKLARIRKIVAEVGLHAVQLHGNESPDVVDALRPLSVIKKLCPGDDITPWARVNAILYDTPTTSHELPGGTGKTFDWNTLQTPDDGPPIILAGGLTPGNVADAIRTVRPYGVDVSSGVESQRGVKDTGLIAAFCQTVRTADRT